MPSAPPECPLRKIGKIALVCAKSEHWKKVNVKLPLIVVGAIVTIGFAIWWQSEVRGFVGADAHIYGLRCLIRAGTGDCQDLWLLGMHQTNQIASLGFYAGILMAVFGLLMPTRK
jgi:hypothetical protein